MEFHSSKLSDSKFWVKYTLRRTKLKKKESPNSDTKWPQNLLKVGPYVSHCLVLGTGNALFSVPTSFNILIITYSSLIRFE